MEYEELTQFISVSRETYVRLLRYVELLQEWGAAINLVSGREELWQRHIIDSAQIAEYIEDNPQKAILDMGSGGGLPGLILAIMLPNPITLVESDRRKSLFLKHVVQELKLSHVNVECKRVEQHKTKSDFITARALASLSKLLELSENFLLAETICLFPKGQNHDIEIESALADWSFESELIPSITGDGALLKIRKIKRWDGGDDKNSCDRESKRRGG